MWLCDGILNSYPSFYPDICVHSNKFVGFSSNERVNPFMNHPRSEPTLEPRLNGAMRGEITRPLDDG